MVEGREDGRLREAVAAPVTGLRSLDWNSNSLWRLSGAFRRLCVAMSAHRDSRARSRRIAASHASEVARSTRCACAHPTLALALALLVATIGPSAGHAETQQPERALPARSSNTYLVLAPLGGAVHLGGGWDAGFGAALSLVRVREDRGLALVGTEVGGLRLASSEHGLVWADLSAGSHTLGGLLMGLGAGVHAELSPVFSMRWGGHATIWAFLGITPYGRIGVVQRGGTYVEFGIQVPLPAFRF